MFIGSILFNSSCLFSVDFNECLLFIPNLILSSSGPFKISHEYSTHSCPPGHSAKAISLQTGPLAGFFSSSLTLSSMSTRHTATCLQHCEQSSLTELVFLWFCSVGPSKALCRKAVVFHEAACLRAGGKRDKPLLVASVQIPLTAERDGNCWKLIKAGKS